MDGIIFYPIAILDEYFFTAEHNPAVLIIWAASSYSAYWLYSVIFHATRGQTLGKMAAQVKVLDVSETRIPTFSQAVLRDIAYVILHNVALAYVIFHFDGPLHPRFS